MNEMLSSRIKDIKGQKFGKLLVIEYLGLNNQHKAIWKCSCECGDFKNVEGVNLRRKLVQSCGCLKKLNKFEASINKLFYTYKMGAKKRNYKFELNRIQFEKLILNNCHYCNTCPDKIFNNGTRFNGYVKYNGIDRKESTLGYNINNCVTCCTSCNYAKYNKSYNEFQNWLINLVNYRNGLK